jgi:hypothetical protein
LLSAAFFYCSVAVAHHSSAPYDVDTRITLRGIVTSYEWRNPHVYIDVETVDERGETAVWEIEAYNPGMMGRHGWSPESLAVGERVTVTAYGPKNPERAIGLGLSVIKADGTPLAMPDLFEDEFEAEPERTTPAAGLSGRWLNPWNAEVADQFGRRTTWSLTEKGRAALASYNDSENPGRDCALETAPYIMVYPVTTTIEHRDDLTVIRYDGYVERTVHMSVDTHDGAELTLQGHSIGRWEGDALVVDTSRFLPHRGGNGFGIPSGLRKHLVERFELADDRTMLRYTFRLEDPEYLAQQVSATIMLAHRPDLPAVPAVPCDLDTARRYLNHD